MKDTIRGWLSRPSTQPALLQLLKLCHAGLNYGGGQSVANSGEIGALRFLLNAIEYTPPFTLFDVGANDGAYLQSALRVLGNQVKSYSFEPQSASFSELLVQFGSDPRVRLTRAALGKESGTAELFFGQDNETTASLHPNANADQTRTETVRLATIDQICGADGVERIDLLKIDTEGSEMEVLQGASAMLDGARISAVQFEFGETFLTTPYHFADLWALLSPAFTIYRILRNGVVEVKHYSHDLEIYKNPNFLCIRKKR